ncbi:hypothetical protein [Microcoleus sp. B4-D4]|uniref:hypothetical protein n=1 Tax=Microcoleus sp. B4-D4 TaxID=2818667 RepID=UPI002FD1221F
MLLFFAEWSIARSRVTAKVEFDRRLGAETAGDRSSCRVRQQWVIRIIESSNLTHHTS